MRLRDLIFGTAHARPSILSQAWVALFLVTTLGMTARPDSSWWAIVATAFGGAGLYRCIFIEVMNRK